MASEFASINQQYFKRIFDLYDRDKIGRMQTEDLPTVVRACGAAPLDADFNMLRDTADPEKRGTMSFEGLCKALKVAFDNSVSPEAVREAFLSFDPDKRGLISQHDLRFFLTTLGVPLTAEETNAFFEEMKTERDAEGNLICLDMVYKMTPEMLR